MSLAHLAAPTAEPAAVGLDPRALPPTTTWYATVAALERADPASWAALMPSLRGLAARLAPSFADVASVDDVLGDLALFAHERWLPEYVGRARRGDVRVSVEAFLRDRLRDHLRELRRRQRRRAALLAPLEDRPLFVGHPPAPDEALEAAELERQLAPDGATRTLLTLRVAGYDQREIAEVTQTSRPTVSRRLAAIAALLVGLGLVLLAAAQWRAREAESIAAEPATPSPRAPTVPAASGDEGDEGDEGNEGNEPSTDLLDPWSGGEPTPDRADDASSPTRHTDDLLDPFDGLRVPRAFRPAAPPPRTSGSELLDPFARPARSNDDASAPRRARPRPSSAQERLVDPFAPSASPEPTSQTRPSGRGVLVVNALPWAAVYVDGRPVGNTPITRLPVDAGRRTLELRFSNGVVRRISVDVVAGQTHRVAHRAD